jgi:hypothetical protein
MDALAPFPVVQHPEVDNIDVPPGSTNETLDQVLCQLFGGVLIGGAVVVAGAVDLGAPFAVAQSVPFGVGFKIREFSVAV